MSAPDLDRQCSYATHSADYCHAHDGYLIDHDTGMCDKYALDKAIRWDARDEALCDLIENWESTARVLSARYDDTGERELRGRSKALRIAADELERAIGGGES